MIVTPEVILDIKSTLTTAQREHVDLVIIGCPHASYPELCEIADLIRGKRVKDGTRFWIQTGKIQQGLIKRSGIEKKLDAGVFLINDTCINNFQMSGWNFDTIVTNSGKDGSLCPEQLEERSFC